MKYSIDKESKTPLYQQLAEQIDEQIQRSKMRPGDVLPTVRKLAANSGVSHITAVKAYQYLEQQGIVRQEQGRGTFVASPPEQIPNPTLSIHEVPPSSKSVNDARYSWQRSLQASVSAAKFRSQTAAPIANDSISFAVSYPDATLWPSDTLGRILAQISTCPEQVGGVVSSTGEIGFREAITTRLTNIGIRCNPDDVMVTSGTQQGIDLVARTLLRPGDWVACEETTYSVMIDVLESAGCKIMPVPIDSGGMDVDILDDMMKETKVRLIYTIPNFHNPTGKVLDESRRHRLVELAEKHNAIILEDDPFRDFYYAAPPPKPIKSFDTTGRVIYLGGLTKILYPGLRLGTLVASGPLMEHLTDAKIISDMFTNPLTQRIANEILRTDFAQIIETNRRKLRERRNALASLITEHLHGATFDLPQGGLNLWVALPNGITDRRLFDQCLEENVQIAPGHVFISDRQESEYIRLSFAGTAVESIRTGVMRIARALRALTRRPGRSFTRSGLPMV